MVGIYPWRDIARQPQLSVFAITYFQLSRTSQNRNLVVRPLPETDSQVERAHLPAAVRDNPTPDSRLQPLGFPEYKVHFHKCVARGRGVPTLQNPPILFCLFPG